MIINKKRVSAALACGLVPNIRCIVLDSSTIYAPPRIGMSVSSMVGPQGISIKPKKKVKTVRFGRLHTDERFAELKRESIPRKFLFRTVRATKKFFERHPFLLSSEKQMLAVYGAPCKSEQNFDTLLGPRELAYVVRVP